MKEKKWNEWMNKSLEVGIKPLFMFFRGTVA